jgi:predicted Zn finger-like uncharacterized protein
MRLVCPNCDAEYEVDDNLVPAEGRDVQCSNCTTTWFQAALSDEVEPSPADVSEEPEEKIETSSDDDETIAAAAALTAASSLPSRQPTVSPEALDVIHEEVAIETAAREAELGGIETQPDLGLDDAETEARASAARDRMSRRRGLEPDVTTVEDDESALAPAPQRDDPYAKSELFPDIEEINSTLSPETAEAEAEAARLAEEGGEAIQTQRSGFRLGFGLVLLFVVGLLLLYVYAPQLSQSLPVLSGALDSYVAAIDSLRVWLDTAAQGLVEKIGVTLSDKSTGQN